MSSTSSWRFTSALTHIAGPSSFSWWIFFVYATPVAIANILVDSQGNSHNLVGWLITAALGTVAAGLVFLIFGTWIYPLARTKSSQIVVALVGYICVGIARGISVARLSVSLEVAQDELWLYRTLMASVYALAMMCLAAIMVNDARAYEFQRAELKNNLTELEALQKDLSGRIEKLQKQLISDTAWEVKSSIQSISEAMQRHNRLTAPEGFVDRIINVIDQKIRPLSTRLLSVPNVLGSARVETVQPLTPRQILTAGTSRDVFAPGPIISIWILISIALGLSLRLGSAGILAFLTFSVLLTLCFILARALLPRFLLRINLLWRVVLISSVYAVSATFSAWLSAPLLPAGEDPSNTQAHLILSIYTPIFAVLFGWLVAIIRGLNYQRAQILSVLEVNRATVRRDVAIAQSMLHITSKRLSRRVHGEVQGTLLANAFRLQQAIDKDQDLDSVLEEIEKDIEAINVTDLVLAPVPSVEDALSEDQARWDKALAISVSISDDLRARLDSDEPARAAIVDCVRESFSNAFKHGHATQVDVTLTLEDDYTVRAEMADNGRGVTGEITEGSGSAIMRELSLDFGLKSTPHGCTAWALFPLSTLPNRTESLPT